MNKIRVKDHYVEANEKVFVGLLKYADKLDITPYELAAMIDTVKGKSTRYTESFLVESNQDVFTITKGEDHYSISCCMLDDVIIPFSAYGGIKPKPLLSHMITKVKEQIRHDFDEGPMFASFFILLHIFVTLPIMLLIAAFPIGLIAILVNEFIKYLEK